MDNQYLECSQNNSCWQLLAKKLSEKLKISFQANGMYGVAYHNVLIQQ